MNDSFARRLMIQGELDDLTSIVDRLSIDQQAFMSTGDDRFQDGVYASIVTLDRRLEGLNASMAGMRRNVRAWSGYPRQSSRWWMRWPNLTR
ncbi:MAG TPA: hypothetical protein VGH29_11880 [Candidatus Binataceae bacterium]